MVFLQFSEVSSLPQSVHITYIMKRYMTTQLIKMSMAIRNRSYVSQIHSYPHPSYLETKNVCTGSLVSIHGDPDLKRPRWFCHIVTDHWTMLHMVEGGACFVGLCISLNIYMDLCVHMRTRTHTHREMYPIYLFFHTFQLLSSRTTFGM